MIALFTENRIINSKQISTLSPLVKALVYNKHNTKFAYISNAIHIHSACLGNGVIDKSKRF